MSKSLASEFLTPAQLSRLEDLPLSTVYRLIAQRKILPDAQAGRFSLFDAGRISELSQAIEALPEIRKLRRVQRGLGVGILRAGFTTRSL